jgi:Ca-activated chloride channel family protein
VPENLETREASAPGNVKFGKYIGAGQDVFMTVKLRAVEAPCRRLTGDAKLLESQFLHDAAAADVTVEVPYADRLRAKAAERVTSSGVCRLRRHAMSGVFSRHPITGLIDVCLIGEIQRGSDDEISVDPMESGQRDTRLTLEVHRPSNGVLKGMPHSLVVERPSHPKLQIGRRTVQGEKHAMLRHIPGLFLFLCVPAVSFAQVATIKVDKDLVLVPVGVVDRDNRPVINLERKNFRIFENKVEQAISSFLMDDEPLAAGLVFDTSGSVGRELRRSRMAANAFFETANPEDEFLLVEFSTHAALSVPLTNDPRQIEDRLALTESKRKTALLDAIYLGLTEIKKSKKSRKALLVLSDGGDNNSRYTRQELVNLARESDVLIYVMGIFAPSEFLGPDDFGPRLLISIAQQTGGREYSGDFDQLPRIAKQIGVELRNRFWASRLPMWSATADITTSR